MRRQPQRGTARPTVVLLGAALLASVGLATAPAAHAVPGPGQVAAPLPAPGPAASRLPDRWRLVTDADGLHLVWTPATPLRMTDARVEIRADGRSLGPARVARDGSTVTVDLTAPPRSPGTVQALLGGRRLDAPSPLAPAARSVTAEEQLPAQDAVAVDPGVPGTLAVTTGEYTAPDLAVPGFPAKVEMRAVVVSPAAGAAGAAAEERPLVLFLHGRHATCYRGGPTGDVSGDWPCPRGWTAVPSYRGYLQAQQLLASQGYDTVSISADGINGQDFAVSDGGAAARSLLVRAHLQLWAGWTGAGRAGAPDVIRATAPADLGRLLLVGHSRGGEGVNRAALDSATGATPVPWHVAGQLLLAPTAFGGNPAPGVPTVVLLPYCDGDVFDLQGQLYVDAGRDLTADPALRSALLVRGANHNFFNSEWTPGTAQAPADDDWFDQANPVCGSRARQTAGQPRVRLTAAEQRQVGAAYTAAAAAVLVRGDPAALGALDGSGLRLPSAGRARVSAHALGANRHPFAVPGQGVTLTSTAGVRTRTCIQNDRLQPERSCIAVFPGDFPTVAPHLLGSFGVPGEPQRRFAEIGWDAAGGRADLTLARPVSLVGDEKLALRIFTEPGAAAAHFRVRVTDTAGHSADLGDPFLGGLADAQGFGKAWALELRMPLGVPALKGVDLSRISRLSVLPLSGPGRLWLVDSWGWRPGLSDAAAPVLPRVDVGLVTVAEGSSGTRTVQVPVSVTGPARGGQVVAVVEDVRGTGADPTATVLTVTPGTRSLSIPFPVTGNRLDDEPLGRILVTLEPYRGLSVGAFSGGLQIRDDDPSPVLSVRLVRTPVAEGRALTYRVTLSGPSNRDVFGWFDVVAPAAGKAELSSSDVPDSWLFEQGVEPPARATRLSRLGLQPSFDIPPGATVADVTVPTRTDTRAEGEEHVVLKLSRVFSLDRPPLGLRLDGAVTG